MPMSTGALTEAVIESIEKQVPWAPASGCPSVTDSADCRSVKTGSHSRNSRSTCGEFALGTRFPGAATRTQEGVIGLLGDATVHWKTPAAVETIDTSVVLACIASLTSTRQVPSAPIVATTLC